MSPSKRLLSAALTAVALTATAMAGIGPAQAAGATLVPLTGILRNCDFSETRYVSAFGTGSGFAMMSAASGKVTADVHLGVAKPNTPYQVRLIQVPRPSYRTCNAGDAGVATAVLNTDANGTGQVTLQGDIQSGATGAWVSVDGPAAPGRVRGDFYTSEIVTSLT